jgi:hypothetical protein
MIVPSSVDLVLHGSVVLDGWTTRLVGGASHVWLLLLWLRRRRRLIGSVSRNMN